MAEIIVTSSILIVLLMILRQLCRNKISRRLQYALWLLAAVRLLTPVSLFGNPLNVMNMLSPVTEQMETWAGSTLVYQEKVLSEYEEFSHTEALPEEMGEKNSRSLSDASFYGEAAEVSEAEDTEYKTTGLSEENTDFLKKEERNSGENTSNSLTLHELEQILEGKSDLFSIKWLLRYIWFAGMAVMAVWMGGCNLLYYSKILRNRKYIGTEGGVNVYITEKTETPCLLGILHPAVYLTPDCAQNQNHRKYAIAHELTHYRHRDHIWIFIRNLCLVIHWFNPFVWIGTVLASRDCELACDEGVMESMEDEQSREYGAALIEMAVSSLKGQKILRCEAGMAFGKKELMERIAFIARGKRNMGILAAILVTVCMAGLAACTFGGTKQEPEMGRYVEAVVELPGKARKYAALSQNQETIRIISQVGTDILSVDGGVTFEKLTDKDMPPGVSDLYEQHPFPYALEGSVEGARILSEYKHSYSNGAENSAANTFFINEMGEEIQLKDLDGSYVRLFYSNGCFYIYASDKKILYRLDPGTGEMQLLTEGISYIYYMAADEKLLYLVTSDDIILHSMETGATAEQDQVLSDFAAEHSNLSEDTPILLYPYKNGVYLLAHTGIYWHELYTEDMDEIVDGGFCSIGDISREFTGMAVCETDTEPEFLILYNETELMRYTYDASLAAVPEALRVYSVYEDSQVIQAVNAFRAQYPDIPVLYESGMNSEYGNTIDDVLKNLATEIASGNGPDILVMDDIPFDSYVEKGVLADLSDLRKEMTEEDWFVNVIDAFAREEKLYAIPMTFSVPVLGGKEENIKGLETLSDLADMLEKEKSETKKDHLFCTWDAESTLRLLSQSSQGAWMKEGTLDREAVTEFLTQAKRIYGINDYTKESHFYGSHDLILPGLWLGDYKSYSLARRFDSDGAYCMIAQKDIINNSYGDYYAGFLSGGERDYLLFRGIQEYFGDTYVQMPGQQYGSCLASSLLAVNSGTKSMEESMKFLEYAVSTDFFAGFSFNGTPVNREAYRAKQTENHESDRYTGYGGEDFNITLQWPSEEDYKKLDRLLDELKGVNICDPVVYEAVIAYGKAALKGETSIPDAVESIEKRVKLYLAE